MTQEGSAPPEVGSIFGDSPGAGSSGGLRLPWDFSGQNAQLQPGVTSKGWHPIPLKPGLGPDVDEDDPDSIKSWVRWAISEIGRLPPNVTDASGKTTENPAVGQLKFGISESWRMYDRVVAGQKESKAEARQAMLDARYREPQGPGIPAQIQEWEQMKSVLAAAVKEGRMTVDEASQRFEAALGLRPLPEDEAYRQSQLAVSQGQLGVAQGNLGVNRMQEARSGLHRVLPSGMSHPPGFGPGGPYAKLAASAGASYNPEEFRLQGPDAGPWLAMAQQAMGGR